MRTLVSINKMTFVTYCYFIVCIDISFKFYSHLKDKKIWLTYLTAYFLKFIYSLSSQIYFEHIEKKYIEKLDSRKKDLQLKYEKVFIFLFEN